MQWCQYPMKERRYNSDSGEVKEPPMIPTKRPQVHCCEAPLCVVCHLGNIKNQVVDYRTLKPVMSHTGVLKQDHLETSAANSFYQYQNGIHS